MRPFEGVTSLTPQKKNPFLVIRSHITEREIPFLGRYVFCGPLQTISYQGGTAAQSSGMRGEENWSGIVVGGRRMSLSGLLGVFYWMENKYWIHSSNSVALLDPMILFSKWVRVTVGFFETFRENQFLYCVRKSAIGRNEVLRRIRSLERSLTIFRDHINLVLKKMGVSEAYQVIG